MEYNAGILKKYERKDNIKYKVFDCIYEIR